MRPRFRTDLVAQPIDEGGQRFVDVTDPDSGNTFRFYEVEYSVACAMDGGRDLDDLVAWSKTELGLEPSHDELQMVISTLDDLGYLESPRGDVELGAPGVTGATPGAAVPGGAPPGGGDVELGSPGKSPFAPERGKPPPAGDVELGMAGAGAADASVPATSGPPPEGGAGGAGAEPEASFAGLLDEDDQKAGAGSSAEAPGRIMEFEAPTPPPAEVPEPSLRPSTQADSDDDGPTNLPEPQPPDFDDEEVSVDLSEHLSIGTDDVKEAVRQSKVMQAVSVPEHLRDELEDEGDEEPARASTPPPTPAPAAAEAAARAKEAVPAPTEEAGSKPVELPEQPARPKPAAVPATAAATTAHEESRSSSAALVLLLLLAIAAVGGFAAWYYLTQVRDDAAAAPPDTEGSAGTEPEATAPSAPEPPASPTAVVERGEPQKVALEATEAGEVGWIEEDGAAVDEGAVVVKMAGYERHAEDFEHYELREEHYRRKLEGAREHDAPDHRIAAYQAKVEQKQALQAETRAKMENYFLKAPATGVVARAVEPGQNVDTGDELLSVEQPPGTTATFTGVSGDYAPGAPIVVAPADRPDAVVDCSVGSFEAGTLTVACPPGAELPLGSDVTLTK